MLHTISFIPKGLINCMCVEFVLPTDRAEMQSIADAFVSQELYVGGSTTI